MNKNCEECGTPIVAARSTKKYCNDICKLNYNRKKKQDVPGFTVEESITPTEHVVKMRTKPPLPEPKDIKVPEVPDWVLELNESLRSKGLPLVMTEPETFHFVPTGVPELDALTKETDHKGIGGFPRKRITEIIGPKGSGKTTLTKMISKNNPDLKILFFDAEGGMISPPPNVHVVKGNVVEEIMPSLIDAVIEQRVDLIILDSVASLVTKKHFDNDPEGKASMARAFGPEVKRLVAHLQPLVDGLPDPRPGVAVVFINQFRDTTQSFGKMEYTVGGRSLEYYSSLRLVFRSNKSHYKMKEGKIVGQKVKVTVDKNRFGPPQTETEWVLPYDDLQKWDEMYRKRIQELLG